MREKYIIDYEKDDKILDYFVVMEDSNLSEDKNGKEFGRLIIGDKTGKINCRCWSEDLNNIGNEEFEKFKTGDIVKVTGTIDLYNENPQLRISDISLVTDISEIDETDLYRVAPIEPEKIYEEILKILETEIIDEEYKNLCINIYTTYKNKLIVSPAAKTIHHNYKGGLLWHTYRMLQLGIKITEVYDNIDKSLLLSGVALHDVGKISELSLINHVPDYTFEGNMLGHLLIGTMIINNTAKDINLSKEKKILIEHLIASHHGSLEWDAIKEPELLEAYVLHHIDMIDSGIERINDILNNTLPGEFNQKIYKPLYLNKEEKE